MLPQPSLSSPEADFTSLPQTSLIMEVFLSKRWREGADQLWTRAPQSGVRNAGSSSDTRLALPGSGHRSTKQSGQQARSLISTKTPAQ